MITFVGAGPGDPDLITVKGQKAMQEADLVLYAGSLVPTALLKWARPDADRRDSAGMALEDQIELMSEADRAGKRVVRLHTGDPALYGATGEQMAVLDRLGISYTIVPGVSSFLAAAASLGAELTLPGISQTVIITRCAGRTPVPDGQELAALAAHQATMAIFLSAGHMDETLSDLLQHYPASTPAAIVQRASWPEEKIIRGSLGDLSGLARDSGIDRTAMILVGAALANQGDPSRLYDAAFSHGCREASRDDV